jgi:hypothetical protein
MMDIDWQKRQDSIKHPNYDQPIIMAKEDTAKERLKAYTTNEKLDGIMLVLDLIVLFDEQSDFDNLIESLEELRLSGMELK